MALTVELYRGSRGFDGTPDANDRLSATADMIRDWLGGTALHPELADLTTRMDRMEARMATLAETIEAINARTNQLAEVITSVQTTVADLRTRLNAGETLTEEQLAPLEATLAAMVTQLQEIAADPDAPVPSTPAPDPVSPLEGGRGSRGSRSR